MAKQPETLFKERVQRDLKKVPHCWAVKIQQVALRGIPDILICLRGQFIALELKRSDKQKPDPLQRVTLDRIVAAGGWGFAPAPENWPSILQILVHLAHGRAKEAAEAAAVLSTEIVMLKDDFQPTH